MKKIILASFTVAIVEFACKKETAEETKENPTPEFDPYHVYVTSPATCLTCANVRRRPVIVAVSAFAGQTEIEGYKTAIENGKNPRDVKIDLAKELITRFHDEAAAEAAHQEFINRFQKGAMPDEMPELDIATENGEIAIANLLKEARLVASTSDAYRMIKQGAAKIDGEKITDRNLVITRGSEAIYQVGKRKFAKVSVK